MIEDVEKKGLDPKFIIVAAVGAIVSAYLIFNFDIDDFYPNSARDIPIIREAPEGTLAPGFPEDLSLNRSTDSKESYTADYPRFPDVTQATVSFNTSDSPEDNFDFYLKWAKDNGWQILNSNKNPPVLSIYLKKAEEDINITIHGYLITISHVKK